MHQNTNTINFLRFLVLVLVSCLSGVSYAGPNAQLPVPAGSPMREYIHYQLAIYYLPKSNQDPLLTLRRYLARTPGTFKLVKKISKSPKGLLLQAHLNRNVQKEYSPPPMDSLKYFAHGLNRKQAQALQKSRQALILNFAYPRKHVWDGLHAANELVEILTRQTGGLAWDDMTREVYTPDAWHTRRLKGWTQGVPDISTQTTIHAYKNGEFVRAITLGMAKVGLPDVVVDNFSWSSNRQIGNLINLFTQAMAEGAKFSKAGKFDLNIKAIRHPAVREPQLTSLLKNATAVAKLSLHRGNRDEGDPYNRLIQITFERYPGHDVHAQQDAMLSSLFGSKDKVTPVKDNAALLAASKRAKAKLPALHAAFKAGLQPGEFIEVKVPFRRPDGGNEWMWVEVSKWHGNAIEGLLKNEPYYIPSLHGGQIVKVKQQDVFDYIHRYPDGKQEGNETGKIIQKMQEK